MKLFGREISKSVLAYEMRYTTRAQDEAIVANLKLEAEQAARARMIREKDPETKARMKQLIAKRVYDLDVIFGPEK